MRKFIECKRDKLTLRGIAHIPDNIKEKIPAVICFHGFTGTNVGFGFSFVELSDLLERTGVASFRFDFNGTGLSDGEFCDMTTSNEIEDADAIINYVKSLDFIDSDRICILGMSLGGVVASMIAPKRKDDIKLLCLWSPATCVTDDLKNNRVQDVVITNEAKKLGYVDVKGVKLGMGYVNDGLNLNIFDVAKEFDKDVLLIHGSEDNIVPVRYSEKLANGYGDKVKFIKIEGAGHTYQSISMRNELMKTTLEYIKERL